MEICENGRFFKNRMTAFIREEEKARRRREAESRRLTVDGDDHHPDQCRAILQTTGRSRQNAWQGLKADGPTDLDLIFLWTRGSSSASSELRELAREAAQILHFRQTARGYCFLRSNG